MEALLEDKEIGPKYKELFLPAAAAIKQLLQKEDAYKHSITELRRVIATLTGTKMESEKKPAQTLIEEPKPAVSFDILSLDVAEDSSKPGLANSGVTFPTDEKKPAAEAPNIFSKMAMKPQGKKEEPKREAATSLLDLPGDEKPSVLGNIDLSAPATALPPERVPQSAAKPASLPAEVGKKSGKYFDFIDEQLSGA